MAMTLRLPEDLQTPLAAYATAHRESMSTVIEMAVREFLIRQVQNARINAAIGYVNEHYGDVFDELADR